MADYVYVVMAEEGGFGGDHHEWVVAVYTTEEQASDHCNRAKEWAKKNTVGIGNKNPFDPGHGQWYAPSYSVGKVPYVCHVDEYLKLDDDEKEVRCI